MNKGQATRQRIVAEAAALFNRQGYANTSISDLMAATGLRKGGLYNHFSSKDDLFLAAFDYAVEQVTREYRQALRQERQALKRMDAIFQIYQRLVDAPLLPGGCPVLNAAIESDDTHPQLRSRVQQVMTLWQSLIAQILRKGVERGELQPHIDIDAIVTILIATLEGAIMMSKLYDDGEYIERAIAHLRQYLASLAQTPSAM